MESKFLNPYQFPSLSVSRNGSNVIVGHVGLLVVLGHWC